MSTLSRFDIGQLSDFYKFKYLVETGTGFGTSVYENARFFEKVYTFEIHTETFDIAKDTLKTINNVQMYNIESMRGLPMILPAIQAPTLFYLDARFPGMMIGDPIDFDTSLETNAPVFKEIQFLFTNRNLSHDAIVIGGLYMWEEGGFGAGRFNSREEFKDANPLPFIKNSPIERTHYITTNYLDEGYLLIRPKQGL
jgi:hypothetical protein